MKKIIAMLLCVVLVLSLTGCEKEQTGSGAPVAGGADLPDRNDVIGTDDAQEAAVETEIEKTVDTAMPVPRVAEDDRQYANKVAFANWTDDSRIYSAALNGKTMTISSVQHLPVYKFDTAAELEAFKTSYADILTMDRGLDEIPSFADITVAYDDSFFGRYSLLLAYVPAGSGSYRFGVSDVYCDGQSFCMYVEQLNNPEVYDAMMAGWFAVVEADKEDIENCVDFDAQLRHMSGGAGIVDTDDTENKDNSDVRKDVCELYLEVLEDIWNVDSGLNSGISQLGLDLSGLSQLTEAEKEAVMERFASKHDLPYVAGTWVELCEQGYIDKDNLCWEDGLFFSIKTNEDASFDVQKWRSGLGAYFFSQCTARKNDDGTWSYTVGCEAIS